MSKSLNLSKFGPSSDVEYFKYLNILNIWISDIGAEYSVFIAMECRWYTTAIHEAIQAADE
jgi:hypothetical protein